MKNKINKIIKALMIIYRAFEANFDAHQYRDKSQDAYCCYDHDGAKYFSQKKSEKYIEKEKYILEAIRYIKKNKLPIKYWIEYQEAEYDALYRKSESIIFYFCFAGKQVSFHGVNLSNLDKIKKYNGKWSNRLNNDLCPFKEIICHFNSDKNPNKYEKFSKKYGKYLFL